MEILLVVVFIAGYLAIAFEHPLHINKAASAILTAVICWTIYIVNAGDAHVINHELAEHLGEISGILFFLLGAMTIVELIDSHHGFSIITDKVKTNEKRKLLWIFCILTFFLSAVLDNLTTSIVMTSLSRKMIGDRKDRMIVLGMIVIAANAGGAWSPIGDVTTTMLWIGGQITAGNIVMKLIVPSLVCMLVPLALVSFRVHGTEEHQLKSAGVHGDGHQTEKKIVLTTGIVVLLFVPVFKTITHLPPYMGILFGLGVMWIVTELLHKRKPHDQKHKFTVTHALERIDTSSILFFLGILVAVASLQSTGLLKQAAGWLDQTIGNTNVIVIILGLLSSVIDNVPLVAAAMGMYDISLYPTDHYMWEFLAYTCGTGGSALIIGSAAGVAVMGMERIEFFWYIKNITLYALAGYFAGAFTYILMEPLWG